MAPLVRLARFHREERAVSMIEFAFCLPILSMVTLWMFELTNYALVRQQVSQLALQVADNASRIGTLNGTDLTIGESDINDLFTGANLQSGKLNMASNGRIILSSLEVDPTAPKGQYIHWQRCYGAMKVPGASPGTTKPYPSSYGVQGDGKGVNTFTGMGPANARITASATAPVMFVEIGYRYQPIVSTKWAPGTTIKEIAALIVRDNRDTVNPPDADATPSTC